jgi:hypothetical protein
MTSALAGAMVDRSSQIAGTFLEARQVNVLQHVLGAIATDAHGPYQIAELWGHIHPHRFEQIRCRTWHSAPLRWQRPRRVIDRQVHPVRIGFHRFLRHYNAQDGSSVEDFFPNPANKWDDLQNDRSPFGRSLLTTALNILVRSQLERENTGKSHGWQGRPTDIYGQFYRWVIKRRLV